MQKDKQIPYFCQRAEKIVDTLERVPKSLEKKLVEMKIRERIDPKQTATFFRLARIL